MTMRTRKLVGTILLLGFVALYALAAMAAAIVLQVNASKTAELLLHSRGAPLGNPRWLARQMDAAVRFGGHDPIACPVLEVLARSRAIGIVSPKPGSSP